MVWWCVACGGLHDFKVIINSGDSPGRCGGALGVSLSVVLDVGESIVLTKVMECGI